MGRKNQIIATIAVIVVIVVAGYFANRYWIVPSTAHRSAKKIAYSMAPNFTVRPLGGDDLSLSDYRGKVVLLIFGATWCGPCRDETPSFVQMQRKYGPKGFQIIGIAVESSPESIKSFYNEFHLRLSGRAR